VTEDDWLASRAPEPMLTFLHGKTSARKLRLFACACVRRVWHLLKAEPSRHLVEVAEGFADGLVSVAELDQATAQARAPTDPAWWRRRIWGVGVLRASTEDWPHRGAALALTAAATENVYQAATLTGNVCSVVKIHPFSWESWFGWGKAPRAQAVLLRHVIGNPFRPYPAPTTWPATVVQLAEALYVGEPCREPLVDALLESGHPELAEHFRGEDRHPKGCWALDVILGRA
jgi:hypothetical protein